MKPGEWNFLFGNSLSENKEFKIHRYTVQCTAPNYKIPENVDLNDVYDYFVDIVNHNIDIVQINNTNLKNNRCDYCKMRDDDSYYICIPCNKRMCLTCNDEINLFMEIINGPTGPESKSFNYTKNWHKREAFLTMCWNHRENWKYICNRKFYCDICQQTTENVYGKWMSDRNKNIDVCNKCFSKSKFNASFFEWNNEKLELDFNILEWIPVITDQDKNKILFNANIDSPNYSKLMVAYCDISNKWGYFDSISTSPSGSLQEVKTLSIKEICLKYDIPTYYGFKN